MGTCIPGAGLRSGAQLLRMSVLFFLLVLSQRPSGRQGWDVSDLLHSIISECTQPAFGT